MTKKAAEDVFPLLCLAELSISECVRAIQKCFELQKITGNSFNFNAYYALKHASIHSQRLYLI